MSLLAFRISYRTPQVASDLSTDKLGGTSPGTLGYPGTPSANKSAVRAVRH
jgi:hypothetical protein